MRGNAFARYSHGVSAQVVDYLPQANRISIDNSCHCT